MSNCKNCIYKNEDKERSGIVHGCSIAKRKNDDTLMILGRKGLCPYHEYPEYYGFK